MANLSITATGVLAGTGARILRGRTAGAAVTQMQPCYKDTDGTYKPAIASGTALQAKVAGLALNAAAGTGQPIDLIQSGPVTVGATLAVGKEYSLSATSGLICPIADITTSGHFVVPLFQAISTTVGQVNIIANAVALA